MEKFVNTFEDGLRSNIDPNFQPENTYRYSLNGKIVNVQGSDYTWESVNGTKLSFSLPGKILVGHIDSPKKLFLLTIATNNPDLSEIGYVEKVTTNGTNTYTILYCTYGEININTWILDVTVNLGFRSDRPYITGYYNLETENIERIYLTDETDDPKVLNIAKLKTTYTRTQLWDLQIGHYYMVLQGWAQPTGHSPLFKGYVFKHFTSFQDASTDVLIVCIDEARPNILSFSPDITFNPVQFYETIDGNLTTGTYYVGYRLICDGYKTPFSPLAGPFTLRDYYYNQISPGAYKGIPGKETGKGLQFRIKNTFPGYTKIEYCVFTKTDAGIVSDGVLLGPYNIIANATHNIFDLVNLNGSLLNISEYTKANIIMNNVKDMTQIDNSLVVGNVNLFNLPGSSQQITGNQNKIQDFLYEMPGDINYKKYSESINLPPIDPTTGVASGDILPGLFYKVISGSVGYNGTSYVANTAQNRFVGVATESGFSGTGIVFPVILISRYYNHKIHKHEIEEYVIKDELGYRSIISDKMAGYWGNETYRIGILPISKKGTPMPVIWFMDHKVGERDDSYDFVYNPITDGSTSTKRNLTREYTQADGTPVLNTLTSYLMINVDLNDIIDDISGFCIVRSVRDKTIKAEGYVTPMFLAHYKLNEDQAFKDDVPERPAKPEYWEVYDEGTFVEKETRPDPNFIAFTSPDNLINEDSYKLISNDRLKYRYTLKANATYANQPGWPNTFSKALLLFTAHYQKVTQPLLPDPIEPGIMPDRPSPDDFYVHEAKIVTTNNEEKKANEYVYQENKYYLHNIIRATRNDDGLDEENHFDYGGKYLFLRVNGETRFATSDDCLHVYQLINNKASLYGGTTPEALQNSSYMIIGHYQEVDETFKENIYDSKNGYVAEDIAIFGGDCYVNVFYNQYSYPLDFQVGFPYTTTEFPWHRGLHLRVPLQTETNIFSWSGRDIYAQGPKVAVLAENYFITDTTEYFGQRFFNYFEEFAFSKQFHSPLDNVLYPGVSALEEETSFKNRFYYSLQKINGELQDSFRIFLTNNYLDLEGRDGELINVRSKMGRLFCFQEKSVSYIPVSERALQANELGLPIQLGIGGRFDRNDVATRTGNLFKLGLTETDDGFTWFDVDRKEMILVTLNLQDVEMTLMGGVKNQLLNDFGQQEITDVIAGYDPFDRTIYVSVTSQPTNGGKISRTTFSYNYLNKRFEGYHSLYPTVFINFLSRLIAAYPDGSATSFDLINVLGETTILGNSYMSILKIIVGSKQDGPKRFISSVIKGSAEFFDEITFETEYDYDSNSFENTCIDNNALIGQHYRFVNGEWRFGLPQDGNLNMHEDSIMQIGFKKVSLVKKIKVVSIVTFYNKRQ